MIYMICRNRVEDFAQWKGVFESHAAAHRDVGITLVNIWRGVDEPNNVFFILKVADKERALKFINAPESAEAGQAAGVVDGEFHFVEEVKGD